MEFKNKKFLLWINYSITLNWICDNKKKFKLYILNELNMQK